MPRRFDYEHVETIRRRQRLQVQELAKRLGYSSHTWVSKMLAGDVTPVPEQIPAWAAALGVDINEDFPLVDVDGNPTDKPNMQDLRVDQGIKLKEIPGIIGTASALPVIKAEKGKLANPLAEKYAIPLAHRYRVTLTELRAAEERSRLAASGGAPGPIADEEPTPPATLAEKITHHLQALPEGSRPTDADIAAAINARAERPAISPSHVQALRTGAILEEEIVGKIPESALHQGLSDALKAPTVAFQSSSEQLGTLMDTVSVLANQKDFESVLANQQDFELHARGGMQGISPTMAAKLKALLHQARAEATAKQHQRPQGRQE
ncbi:helix-turn-helix domain-containing protein [Streptomyces nigrescens]|uniref:helix-turn-helix domain-containing protein n=1 Tax=Streptomyces nigrescens TaxID=1920 RepID=UPI0036FCC52B